MSLTIDGGRVPPRWAERQRLRLTTSVGGDAIATECVRIAFVNNMPDPALEDTEMQFFELLDDASGDLPLRLKLYSLTGVSRSDKAKAHVNEFYVGTHGLGNDQFDGMIMTGTEPRHSDLRNEPYWLALTNVLDWAEYNTASTILSCLAAHAGVLYSDGIERYPLPDKHFGVFDHVKGADHELTNGVGEPVRFPHSRWNEVRADALAASGYVVLTQSAEGSVDSFVKKKKHSLFVHFQGHPEYGAQTLLKEYRRDIKRFLRGERETYPSMPKNYFDSEVTSFLTDFRSVALSDRREGLIAEFPEAAAVLSAPKTWHSSGMGIYQNWLHYLVAKRECVSAFTAVPAVYQAASGKRSVRP